jgi:hypothetical protein
MKHEALIKRLEVSCLGLDAVDPLRLLVNDVVAALAQPEQEPVGRFTGKFTVDAHDRMLCEVVCSNAIPTAGAALYDAPPQRTWVGMTDEEKVFCAAPTYVETVARIENRLKVKNQ